MPSLVDRVRMAIREYRLLDPSDRVIVGVSGGSDSVALLYALRALAADDALRLVSLAHVNHQLRGASSDDDERFCRDLARRLAIPIDVGTTDVRTLARDRRASIEATARTERYAFLDAVAAERGATRIAVGHTRDDQAETFLLKLVRGAGPRGLGGIYPRRGAIIRPLLSASRADVLAYLESLAVPFREDETNADLGNPRNLVRHELLPWFRSHMNPAITEALARAATVAREDADWLAAAADEAGRDVVRVEPGRVELDIERLLSTPRALARRIVRQAVSVQAPGGFVGFEHVEAVERVGRGPNGRSVDLPGQRVVRAGGRIVLSVRVGRGAVPVPNFFRVPLSIPGEAVIPAARLVISARPAAWLVRLGRPDAIAITTQGIRQPLAVRNRRPGDVLRVAGYGRRRKLQDLLVDHKVPKCARDRVPIVVDADDRILWVVGYAESHDFMASESSPGVIILSVRPVGDTD